MAPSSPLKKRPPSEETVKDAEGADKRNGGRLAAASSSAATMTTPSRLQAGSAGVDHPRQDARSIRSVRAPSIISLSRPHSLLAPSRPSPSTPMLGAGSPASLLSASPSASSFNAEGAVHAGRSTRNGESSAMGRLRRVASNASMASSLRMRLTPTVAGASDAKSDGESLSSAGDSQPPDAAAQASDSRSASGRADANQTQQSSADSADEPSATSSEEAGEAATASKRQLESPRPDQIAAKQSRRRTWYGFMAGEADPNPQAQARDSDAVNADTEMRTAEADDDDEQRTIKGTIRPHDAGGTVKSWLSWRAPEASSEDALNSLSGPHAGSGSYVDSVRRYVSWGTQALAPGSSPDTAGWGWPAWRAASNPPTTTDETGEATNNNAQPTHRQQSSDGSNQNSASQSDPSNRNGGAPIDVKMQASDHYEGSQNASTTASSPAQASFIQRWMPAWGRSSPLLSGSEDGSHGDAQDTQDEHVSHAKPTTPAEQYKAEALAHLGAKDAILNSATRSTWINYFGSRSAAPKYKMKDEDLDEPEVMRIDDGKGTRSSTPNLAVPNSRGSGASTPAETRSVVDMTKAEAMQKQVIDPASAKSRPVTPLTKDKETAQKVVAAAASSAADRTASGKEKGNGKQSKIVAPNLLLPSFDDTFSTPPRSTLPKSGVWEKTMSLLFNKSPQSSAARDTPASPLTRASIGATSANSGEHQARLPRSWTTMGDKERIGSRGCKGIRKVTVIGIHGWFSQGPIRNLFGEPTGTSTKFASMMVDAVKKQFEEAGHALRDDQISTIALLGDGLVSDRVDKSFASLLSNAQWMEDLRTSDAVLVSAHSQGSIVATHLLARLVEQRHLDPRTTRIVLLCMCGIHNGPFAHLRGSISSYYLNTFETPAAKELFDFQNGHSPVSRLYAASLRIVCAAGIKLVYVASLDDQVVPLFSALHTSASHPSILRAIFCDGSAFPRVDFLTNLLSFCMNVRNAGLWDHHLVTLLSSSVAGSLYGGLGHSIIYEDPQVYRLAVRYLTEVTSPASFPTVRPGQPDVASSSSLLANIANLPVGVPALDLDDEFTLARNQKWNSNPYSLPWSLRGLLEDERVRQLFSPQIDKLVQDYLDWRPSTKTLKDVQFRLEPMRFVAAAPQRAPSSFTPSASTDAAPSKTKPSNSKL